MAYPKGRPKSEESKAKAAAAMREWSAQNRVPREERICGKCGETFVMTKGSKQDRKFCSKSCAVASRPTGSGHPNWKGGRMVHKYHGYVLIHTPDRGWVGEHVLVMEDALGRRVLPEETVHHKNGNRQDNRLQNLELWSSRHPSGQRVEDKVLFAVEILALYAPHRLAGYVADKGRILCPKRIEQGP